MSDIYRVVPTAGASLQVGAGLRLHPHPGQLHPGHPVGWLSHVSDQSGDLELRDQVEMCMVQASYAIKRQKRSLESGFNLL